MAMFVRTANQFSPLFKEKNYMFVPKKIEIIQENTEMMNRYFFSLNNIEISHVFSIIDRKLILLTWFLNCLQLYSKQNITRRFEDMNFIFSW